MHSQSFRSQYAAMRLPVAESHGMESHVANFLLCLMTHQTILDFPNKEDAEFLASEQSKFDSLGSQI